jgi:hypothetical protein
MTQSLPYSRLPNEMLGYPPIAASSAFMQAMFIDGDQAAQQRFCDASLNNFPNPNCTFQVMSPLVLVTVISVQNMHSLDVIDINRGVVGEIDVAFWSLVRCSFLDGSPSELMWHPSFMFVDSGPAMASGREIYGYPKAVSTVTRAHSHPSRPELVVNCLHFPKFAADQRAETADLVRITGPDIVSADIEGTSNFTKPNFTKDEFLIGLQSAIGLETQPFGNDIPLPNAGMPQVMLRQIRDATRAGMAALKEVLLVTPLPSNFGQFGPIAREVAVQILPSASHNLQETLGIRTSNTIRYGGWLTFDFKVGWARRLVPTG